jgi:hypothetical protein
VLGPVPCDGVVGGSRAVGMREHRRRPRARAFRLLVGRQLRVMLSYGTLSAVRANALPGACLLAPEPFRRGLALCVALIFAATVAVTRQLSMRLLLADVEKSHQLRQITAAKSEFEALAGTDG